MSLEAVWDVLKWVLLVLAAGFIGQFGRTLALRLIERRRRTAAGPDSPPSSHPAPTEVGIENARLEAQAKIEKKKAKAELKRAKKTDTTPSGDDSGESG